MKNSREQYVVSPRQWPEEYDLCHTFLPVARVRKHTDNCTFWLAQRAKTCDKICLVSPGWIRIGYTILLSTLVCHLIKKKSITLHFDKIHFSLTATILGAFESKVKSGQNASLAWIQLHTQKQLQMFRQNHQEYQTVSKGYICNKALPLSAGPTFCRIDKGQAALLCGMPQGFHQVQSPSRWFTQLHL